LQTGCLPYFQTWCGLNANLECMSEMCCTWLAGNTGCKNDVKKSPSAHHHTTLSSYIFATKACIDNQKKYLLNSNIFSTCPSNMVNFGPLMADISSGVWGTPANFNGFHVFASLLQRCRSPEANQTLHDVWLSPGLVHYTVYTFSGLLPLTEFRHVQNSLCVRVLHSSTRCFRKNWTLCYFIISLL